MGLLVVLDINIGGKRFSKYLDNGGMYHLDMNKVSGI